jgi:hypothetical protein
LHGHAILANQISIPVRIPSVNGISKKNGEDSPSKALRNNFPGDSHRLRVSAFVAAMQNDIAAHWHRISSSPSFPHFIAGITAGALECLVGQPIDTIRVRVMAEAGKANKIGARKHVCR